MTTYLENLWNNILSRDAEKICAQYETLNELDQKTVKEHLAKIVTEEGWHPEQVISAKAALNALSTMQGEN